MVKSAATATKEPANDEQALAELDRRVAGMEGGQSPLDQLLDGHRRGAEVFGSCRARQLAVDDHVKAPEDGQLERWTGA